MRTTAAGPNRTSEQRAASRLRLLAACLVPVLLAAGAPAQQEPTPPTYLPPQQKPQPKVPLGERPQEPKPQKPEAGLHPSVQKLQGHVVRKISISKLEAPSGRPVPVAPEMAEGVIRSLTTRVGQPLDARNVTLDCASLWSERRLAVRAIAFEEGSEVEILFLVLREDRIYERVEFKGLVHLDRREVDDLLGLYADRPVSTSQAEAMRNVLVARYRRDGFAWCSIELKESDPEEAAGDKPLKVLTFRIDEGPKVTIGRLEFRGNRSYPERPFLGFIGSGDYLIRDSHLQSGPAGSFLFFATRGDAFSREVVDEDLVRLQLFYRSRGYLDATVDLADARFSADQTEVDLDIAVVEGPRDKIRSVDLKRIDNLGKVVPETAVRYPAAEVKAVLKVKPGDYFDQDTITRDERALVDFYGARGHPLHDRDSYNVDDAFRFEWPESHYTETAEVDLTYRVVEGTPKTLRDVIIRGNSGTRDKVIRRDIFQMPGERLDMTKVNKSLRYLEATRYFFNQNTMQGPRMQLLPVTDAVDQVDLAFDVEEGETGEFRWGVGFSTGAGLQGTFQFTKRNFDLFNLPSTWNPIGAIGEVLENRAFHGGGQTLDLTLMPGTDISQFMVGFTEPDLFGDYFQTWELRVDGRRRIRRFRDGGYTTDTLGGDLGLSHNFTEHFSVLASFREESVKVKDLAADAPVTAVDAEGRTELRGLRLTGSYRDHDNPRRPTSGFDAAVTGELLGGPLGGDEDLTKLRLGGNLYLPLMENRSGHWHVLRLAQNFGVAHAFGSSNDVYLTERFYMGGGDLRGFDFRGAGPSQFGRALGGEAVYNATLEWSMPLVATRTESQVRDSELLRGVVFSDFGLLGLSLSDPTFHEPRLSVGVGVRIFIPGIEIPLVLDLGWPILYEESDSRHQLYWSFGR